MLLSNISGTPSTKGNGKENTDGKPCTLDSSRKELAMEELEEAFQLLRVMTQKADQNFTEGITKFKNRLKHNLSQNQVASALHKFGANQYLPKLNMASKSISKKCFGDFSHSGWALPL